MGYFARVAKATVNYSPGMRSRHCGHVVEWLTEGECKNFVDPDECSKVRGDIKPAYWCRLWERK